MCLHSSEYNQNYEHIDYLLYYNYEKNNLQRLKHIDVELQYFMLMLGNSSRFRNF